MRGGAVLAAAGLTALGGVAALAGDAASRGAIRITVEELDRRHVDVGKAGPSAGDVDSVRYRLFNRRITNQPIGHGEVLCTSTGYRSRACMATYFLPRGRLVVGGVIASLLHAKVAILGGTGIYEDAKGTLTVTPLPPEAGDARLVFRLAE